MFFAEEYFICLMNDGDNFFCNLLCAAASLGQEFLLQKEVFAKDFSGEVKVKKRSDVFLCLHQL